MKIRTRLLLFLLPTFISSIALISTLLAYNWHKEILDSFKIRLKTAVISAAALVDPKELKSSPRPIQEFAHIQEELGISHLYFLAPNSPQLSTIPKELYITPVYKSADKRLMTGYAPIYDRFGHLMGLVAADIHVDRMDKKFHESLFLVILSASLTILAMIATLFFIANRISRPVQKLNNSALAIAAGQYGESIHVKGPKEIAELATTLNTMSECLLETIHRLKESSLLRERMYGEYECAMLLQHLMLQKNIDDCSSDAIAIRSITFFSEEPLGFLLDFPKAERPDLFQIHMAEAEEEGFEGMYQLLTQYKQAKEEQPHTSVLLNTTACTLQFKGLHQPFLWSLDRAEFLFTERENPCPIESGDLFFLFNEGFSRFYKEEEKIRTLLFKVLRLFAHEGIETVSAMLQKEISFATKRREIEEDLHLLCFQILDI